MLRRISANSLRGHLSFIASDLLEGRGTPSRGLDLAAEYIAAQFRRAGLEPVGDDGYYQTAAMLEIGPKGNGFEMTIEDGRRRISIAHQQITPRFHNALQISGAAIYKVDPADEAAMEKLSAVFTGQKGGPMEGIVPLVGEVLGVERAPFEVVEEGLRHSVRIGESIDFEIEDIVPFGVETGQPVRLVGVFHPVSSEFNAAEAKRSKISAFGIEYEGKTGISASDFSWAA